MRNLAFLLSLLVSMGSLTAQMVKNGQTLYGNEWINYSKNYLKVQVDEDGMYVINQQDFIDNGFTAQQLNGRSFRMHSNGEEVPLYVSNNNNWSGSDYLVFYGEKNDGEIDSYQFKNPESEQLNPLASMYSNNKVYFITVDPNSNNLRYQAQANNVNGVSLIKEDYYIEKTKQVFADVSWSPSVPTDRDLEFSNFITMDGFASRMQNDHTIPIEVKDYNDSGPDPKLIVRTGSNNATHFFQVDFNNNTILNDNYQGSQVRQYEQELAGANIRNNNTNNVRLRGLSTADNINIACIELQYPRNYNAEDQSTFVFYSDEDNAEEYVEIPNYTGATDNFVFDVDNDNVIIPVLAGKVAKVVIPGGPTTNAKLILTNSTQFKSPKVIESKSFNSIDNLNPQYLILTSEILNKSENGTNMISEYEAFRSSELGGEYKTAVINVEDIYDQFGY